MPYKIVKQGEKYRLYNLQKKTFAKKNFNSHVAASNTRNVYMRYDKVKKNIK